MKKVKLNRAVLIQKQGRFIKDSQVTVADDYALHLCENMKAGEVIEDISTDEPSENPEITQDDIILAISRVDTESEEQWTADGKPTVEALEILLGASITAAQRDEAFAEFIQ